MDICKDYTGIVAVMTTGDNDDVRSTRLRHTFKILPQLQKMIIKSKQDHGRCSRFCRDCRKYVEFPLLRETMMSTCSCVIFDNRRRDNGVYMTAENGDDINKKAQDM